MMSTMPERLQTPRYCQLCGSYLVERRLPGESVARLVCESCGFVHYMNPRVVAAVIVEHTGRMLLQQRAIEPSAGLWTFPGGFLEIGETAAQGAVREAREEVGLDVFIDGLLGVYTRPAPGIVLVVYEGRSSSDSAVVGDHESLAVRWFSPAEIPWDHIAFETTEAALRDWIARHSTSSDASDAPR
jgi:ADP-ribose pyrophosphatase YjhB (NUDIX family)